MTTVMTARRRTFDIAVQVFIAVASIAATLVFAYLLLHQNPAGPSPQSVQPTAVVAPR
ncbi:hypothetical protein [Nocardia sp. NPDC051570]|uniref:hypothetical protein n=1 Tax=Nocardia sp. NPDC051570 TaxID=3364324 RepID=UPI0037978ADD